MTRPRAAGPAMSTSTIWHQAYTLFGLGPNLSALIAALPLFTLLLVVGVFRKPAWAAGFAGLGVTILIAIAGYEMPVATAASAAAGGFAFGLFPISWTVFWAIALYRLTVESGKFEIIKRSIASLTTDSRLQALLIAFAFGAFIEGATGFGTPVAVTAAMLTGLGFSPLSASAVCLLANTAPVAFGAIGIPVITLSGVTGLPLGQVSGAVGRICAPVSFLIPAYLIATTGGRAALTAVWPAVLATGGAFAMVQFLASNSIGPQLTDFLSSVSAMAALIGLLRCWRPVEEMPPLGTPTYAGARAGAASGWISRPAHRSGAAVLERIHDTSASPNSSREALRAWMPYLFLLLLLLLWGLKPVQSLLNSWTIAFPWPFLHNVVRRMPPVTAAPSLYPAVFEFHWLSSSGTSCMAAVILSALFLRIPVKRFAELLTAVSRQLFLPIVTVGAVLGIAFLMNYSGATGTLALAFVGAGALFPFFSAFLGWFGVFLTGSDTSANALFGSLQTVTAARLGLDPVLMAAANASGGVMGKMISLQTIAVATAATAMSVSDQVKLVRFTLKHSVVLAGITGLIVLLYACAPG
jgi:lactate permease